MLNKTQLATLFRFAADLLLQDEANALPALLPNTGTAENNPPVKPRGRPRKIFHIKDIASLDVAQLQDVSPEEVEKLRHTLDTLAASQAAAVVEA